MANVPQLDRESDRQRLMPSGHWDWHIDTPFSQGWRVGSLVFVGGQLSLDGHGVVVGAGDIEAQTRNVFNHITRVLEDAGATWGDVVQLNTYYVFDGPSTEAQAYWTKMTAVRLEYLPDPGPCGTAVRVEGLMYDGLLIEVEAVAIASDSNGSFPE